MVSAGGETSLIRVPVDGTWSKLKVGSIPHRINININDDKQGISLLSFTQTPEISTVPFSRDKSPQKTASHAQ